MGEVLRASQPRYDDAQYYSSESLAVWNIFEVLMNLEMANLATVCCSKPQWDQME